MYDHDHDEAELLGWEEFIARQWESVFVSYRSWTALRKVCRRWCDLIEVGLGCPAEIADQLVRAEIVDRQDRDLEGTRDPGAVLAGMVEVVANLRGDLAELAAEEPELAARLLEQHSRLQTYVRALAFGPEADEVPAG